MARVRERYPDGAECAPGRFVERTGDVAEGVDREVNTDPVERTGAARGADRAARSEGGSTARPPSVPRAMVALAVEAPESAPRDALLAVARAAAARVERVPTPTAGPDLETLDTLAHRARGRLGVGTHVLLLRVALCAHIAAAGSCRVPCYPEDPAGPEAPAQSGRCATDPVGPLLDEFHAVVAENGLSLFEADAQVLVARRALLGHDQETALTAVTTALAHLDEPVLIDHAPTVREHRDNVQRSFRLLSGTLISLGMHELASEVVGRARQLAEQDGHAADLARCAYEQVRIDTSWSLRLQRAGRDGAPRIRSAAEAAQTLSGGRAVSLLGDEHGPLLRAAAALDRHARAAGTPAEDPLALEDARELRGTIAASMHDHLVGRLARARALESVGRTADAVGVLDDVLESSPRGEPDLLLAVHRELARLRRLEAGDCDEPSRAAKDSSGAYTDELEAELWSLRQARALWLKTRVAHEKLRREHGEVTAQAYSDPLTGLANRRSLDGTLSRLLAAGPGTVGGQVSIAVVDVDRFKLINDRISHARGDEVLQAVAATLVRSLRTDDVVARFGGDEFVVVLPGCRAEDAATALCRAARETSGMPIGDGTTVSLSVGIAEMFADQPADQPVPGAPAAGPPPVGHDVLVRADAVMYQAKRAGGDAVWLERGRRPAWSAARTGPIVLSAGHAGRHARNTPPERAAGQP